MTTKVIRAEKVHYETGGYKVAKRIHADWCNMVGTQLIDCNMPLTSLLTLCKINDECIKVITVLHTCIRELEEFYHTVNKKESMKSL